MSIEVIGLGAGDINQLPLGIYKKLLKTKNKIFSRTNSHPVIEELMNEGVYFNSFDDYYIEQDEFVNVYLNISAKLLELGQKENIIYVVPGHPLVAEQTVQTLLNQDKVQVEIKGGKSFLDDLFTTLKIDPIEGFQLVDGTKFSRNDLNYKQHIIFAQVYDAYIASEVKLVLLEDLNPDYEVVIVKAVGSEHEEIKKVALHELDHKLELDNLMSIYVPPTNEKLRHTFSDFKQTIATLRGPDGCEWDKKQTHMSLRKYLLEESYELIEAINNQDDENIIEELGDVLLQVMLHSQIGTDAGYFTIDDVIKEVNEKMIRRHPHVFNQTVVSSVEEINANWEAIKANEVGRKKEVSALNSVLKSLPTLQKTTEIIKKAKKSGFDWENTTQIWDKLEEELAEFKEAIENQDEKEMELELGDILFVVADLAHHYKIVPELALTRVNDKFITRFQNVEKGAKSLDKDVLDLSEAEKNDFWEQAKERE
ncbi:MAG TPA: nucleoside triphosphate pyrophosphohydrolase [Pseudogracilibacillus sp.]|nr:nucleoside triphosphate pyrophosphohydrolase [Pseudogracilibacillus sp.]